MKEPLRLNAVRIGGWLCMLLLLALATAMPAAAQSFISPDHVNLTLQACRNTGTIVMPNGTEYPQQFICSDLNNNGVASPKGGTYTDGNLGKGWNELDLVPHRLITNRASGSNTDTFNVIVAADYIGNGNQQHGYDVISALADYGPGGTDLPFINPSLNFSDASCSASWGPTQFGPGVTGGAIETIYRIMQIHQAAGTQCVFDWYQRLAVGASTFSGSSLQSYIFSSAACDTNGVCTKFIGGKETIPLPVNQIVAQSLNKDMSASSVTGNQWAVTKEAQPASLNFDCSTKTSTTPVIITVSWAKTQGHGDTVITTNVYAVNPAARTINATVTDKIYSGTDQTNLLYTDTSGGAVALPANSTTLVINSVTHTIPHGDANAYPQVSQYNDVATASYTDPTDPNAVIPQQTTTAVTATVVSTTGSDTAIIEDVEHITGAFEFDITAISDGSVPPVSPWSTDADYTSLPVSSGSNPTDNGTLTFTKYVRFTGLTDPTLLTGTLSDTATLTAGGFSASASAYVSVDSSSCSTPNASPLSAVKTAVGADTKTYTWGIAKSGDTTVTSSNGTATVNYSVVVTNTGSNITGVTAGGTITVTNPNASVMVDSITDSLTACTVTDFDPTKPLGNGDTVFHYSCSFPDGTVPSALSNTATVSWSNQILSDGSNLNAASITTDAVPVVFTETAVNTTVTVSDPYAPDGAFSTVHLGDSPATFPYSHTFTGDPAGTCTKHTNTATLSTGPTSSHDVNVCVGADLTVSKNTSTALTRTYNWNISKAVDKTTVQETSSGVTFNYTVIASQNSANLFTDSGWTVSGTITVSNPNNWESVTVTGVTDGLGAGCTITPPASSAIPANGSANWGYTCPVGSATGGNNTATATWSAAAASTPDGSATSSLVPFSFSGATITLANQTINVTDCYALKGTSCSNTPLGQVGPATNSAPFATRTFIYSHVVAAAAQGACSEYDNTATITQTSQNASVKVTVCNPKTGALTMGFWQGPNGQSVIKAAGPSTGTCSLTSPLRTYAPFTDLSATATCAQVATYVGNVVNAATSTGGGGLMLKGQMLATFLTINFNGTATVLAQGTVSNLGSVLFQLDPIKGSEDVRTAFLSFNTTTHPYGETASQMLLDASANWVTSHCSATTGTCTTAPYSNKTTIVYASDAFSYINQSQANIAP